MSTVAELEKQLAAAKVTEMQAQIAALLKTFTDALADKYFMCQWSTQHGVGLAVVRYFGFKARESHDKTHNTVEYKTDRAWVQLSGTRKTRSSYDAIGVSRTRTEFNTAQYLFDVTREHVKEITKEHFNMLWESPRVLAEVQLGKWLEILGAEPPQLIVNEHAPDTWKLDFSHVQITIDERSIINGSPFLLPGGIHLLTDEARKFVLRKVEAEEDLERRVAHLAEPCDHRYLAAKADALRALRRKFSL